MSPDDGFGFRPSDRQDVPIAALEVAWREVFVPKLAEVFVTDISFPKEITAERIHGWTREQCINALVDLGKDRYAASRRELRAAARERVPEPPRIPKQLPLPL